MKLVKKRNQKLKETNDIEKYILNKVLMSAIVNCLEAGLISKEKLRLIYKNS